MEAATRVVPRLGIIVPKSIFDVGLGIFYIPVNQNQNENLYLSIKYEKKGKENVQKLIRKAGC